MSHENSRLPANPSQQVDHDRGITFYFQGKLVRALEGDTVASALFAEGRRIFTRSFKYHRPRGLLCCSGDCPNCLMEIDGKPNVRACRTSVHDGLQAKSQHAWPSVDHDLLRIIERFERLLPVGFYYKTLYKPRLLWKTAEPIIRRLAGLGRVRGDEAPEGEYEHRYDYVDVVVVGGGPAGMAAAIEAAAQGALVLLADNEERLGGHLRYETRSYGADSQPAYEVARSTVAELRQQARVRILSGATAFGSYEGGLVAVLQGNILWHVRTKSMVVAAGCHQYPLVFRNNELPGVMLSRAALRLINLFGTRPGRRAVVVTANDEGYAAALECLRAGVQIAEIVDARAALPTAPAVPELRAADVTISTGMTIVEAVGSRAVTAAKIGRVSSDGTVAREAERTVKCDLVLLATSWQGNAALLLQSGCRMTLDKKLGQPVPASMAIGIFSAGEVLGLRSLDEIVRSGQIAGEAASRYARGESPTASDELQQMLTAARKNSPAFAISNATGQRKNFVCLCEDVTEKDLMQGVEEGFDEIETLKRYSTVSMGPCQGRMCSRSSTELCGLATGKDFGAVGTTTARPPITPVPLGALAGAEFHPVKRSSMHYKHAALTEDMMNMGVWKRPFVYTSVRDEYEAVRERAGLIDVSTLGKLVLKGKDAPLLLDKVYTHWFSNLKPGRIRYGVICDDSGTILDDGTVARLAADHYYITTSTGNIDFVEQWMKWWTAGTGWCVHVVNVTAGNAALNLAGPQARQVLAKLTDVDVSPAAFPYMACREGAVAGVPALLLRIGFVGETGWEIHFPAEYGEYLWDALLEAGADVQLKPFGVETQRLLRLEKKHVIVGQDTDALSNPYDAGMSWVVKLDKPDFIGRHAFSRLQNQGGSSRLVGFETEHGIPIDGNAVVVEGKLAGRITSVRFSPHANKYVGLAWVPAQHANNGSTIQFHSDGKLHTATVVESPFYDPEGTKLK
jgi:sarcosine oxidase, subunit alpha